jgi:hypothetical protein
MPNIFPGITSQSNASQQLLNFIVTELSSLLPRPEAQVVGHRPRKHKRPLHHHTHPTPQLTRGNLAIVFAFEQHRATGRLVEPVKQTKQRRLPRPARSNDAQQLAGFYLKADVIDDGLPIYGTGEMLELEEGGQEIYFNL